MDESTEIAVEEAVASEVETEMVVEIEIEAEDELELVVEPEDTASAPKKPQLDFDESLLRALEPASVPDRDSYSRIDEICPIPLSSSFDVPQDVFIGSAALTQLPRILEQYSIGRQVWVAEPGTWAAVEDRLPEELRERARADLLLLEDGSYADQASVERLIELARPSVDLAVDTEDDEAGDCEPDPNRVQVLVAVGTESVVQVVKSAAASLGLPWVAVATGLSSASFVSPFATIWRDGFKATESACSPCGVVLDLDVLVDAPRGLSRSGFGEVASKPLNFTDWWLSNRLEDTRYGDLADEILEHAFECAVEESAGLPKGTLQSHKALARCLVLTGVATTVSEAVGPASGSAHFMSHLWDMRRRERGEDPRPFGDQVGVAACLTSAVFYALMNLEKPSFRKPKPWSHEEKPVRAAHGMLATKVIPQARRKHTRAAERVTKLKERWRHIRKGLTAMGIPQPEAIRKALADAGCPNTLAELGLRSDDAHYVLAHGRDIRNSVTVLDVAWEIGLFPGGIDEVIRAAGV